AGSQRRGVGFAGADADGVVDVVDEDFSVADLAGFGGRGDGLDDLVGLVAWNGDFDLDLRQEVHGAFGGAIVFSVAPRAPITFDLGDGQPVPPRRSQCVTDLVELERLDDGHDYFHGFDPRLARTQPTGRTRQRRGLMLAWAAGESESNPVPTAEAASKPL